MAVEEYDEVERRATELTQAIRDPDLLFQARQVLGNTLLYINSSGGLPSKKHIGSDVAVERERDKPHFRVGRPVKLGPKTRSLLEPGRTGKTWELEARFVVRGHWRNQAHGPKHSLHRRKWIQPYYKGPDLNEALTRTFEVE